MEQDIQTEFLGCRIYSKLEKIERLLNSKKNDIALLNVNAVSRFLDLSKATIYTKCSKGEIPHIKKGKRLYFYKEDLIKYLESGKKGGEK